MKNAFLEYYQALLGNEQVHVTPLNREIVREGDIFTQEHKAGMLAPYTS